MNYAPVVKSWDSKDSGQWLKQNMGEIGKVVEAEWTRNPDRARRTAGKMNGEW